MGASYNSYLLFTDTDGGATSKAIVACITMILRMNNGRVMIQNSIPIKISVPIKIVYH